MKWPLVSRSTLEEVSRQRDELKLELHRIHDILWQNTTGKQLHGTQPEQSIPVPEAEPELSADEKIEEAESSRQRELQAELSSRMRTRPSTVGPALEHVMRRTTLFA